MIQIGAITINWFNDGYNPTTYTISVPHIQQSFDIRQDEMELLVANLTVLIEQNKKRIK